MTIVDERRSRIWRALSRFESGENLPIESIGLFGASGERVTNDTIGCIGTDTVPPDVYPDRIAELQRTTLTHYRRDTSKKLPLLAKSRHP